MIGTAQGAGPAMAGSAAEELRPEEAGHLRFIPVTHPCDRDEELSLSVLQRKLLGYLTVRLPERPTQREMATAIGCRLQHVPTALDALQARGFVRRGRYSVRSVEVLRPATRSIVHQTREEGLARARAWRVEMKPFFDDLYGVEQ